MIDQFAAALPSSRSVIKFGNRANGVETSCDILIDLTGDTPLFTGWEKRDGYFRAAGDDVTALAAVEREASQMIGEFEKPIYVKYDEDLCAHSRTRLMVVRAALMFVQQEQSKVLVITLISTQQYVEVVACVVPCAHQGLLKPLIHLLITSLVALQAFSTITGSWRKNPVLLLHDGTYGTEMIETIARYGRGLPANMLPVSMHSMGRAGHDAMVAAVALGCHQVFVLLNPSKDIENGRLSIR